MQLRAHEPPGTDHRSVAFWSDHRPVDACSGREGLLNLAVLTQARPGRGEDAEPTILYHEASQHGLIGVYDGLGGAGARPIGRTADDRVLSNAYVAARLAHLTVRAWFLDKVSTPAARPDLRANLAEVFGAARRGGTKLAGTLRRDLPTTLALVEHHRSGARRVRVAAHWAGDSRCYLLRPGTGLQQLSRDDSEIHDALQVLIADQPMTNMACGDGEFRIHERIIEVDLPCVLLCATDGFFNYVRAPALFEYELLDCLLADGGADAGEGMWQWGQRLAERVRGYTADDASLALVALGYKGMDRLRGSFRLRHEQLRREHHAPLHELDPDRDRERFVQAREESWRRYRPGYSYYLEGGDR